LLQIREDQRDRSGGLLVCLTAAVVDPELSKGGGTGEGRDDLPLGVVTGSGRVGDIALHTHPGRGTIAGVPAVRHLHEVDELEDAEDVPSDDMRGLVGDGQLARSHVRSASGIELSPARLPSPSGFVVTSGDTSSTDHPSRGGWAETPPPASFRRSDDSASRSALAD
jgi:hypothetical protein